MAGEALELRGGESVIEMTDGRIFAAGEEDIQTINTSPSHVPLIAKHVFDNGPVVSNGVRLTGAYRPIKDTLYDGRHSAIIARAQHLKDHSVLNRHTLTAAVGQANRENISHIQLINLENMIRATPDKYFYLEEMFTSFNVPNLRKRVPFIDVVNNAQFVPRGQQYDEHEQRYDEVEFDLRKLVSKVWTPIEDMYEALLDPHQLTISSSNWSEEMTKNSEAKRVLATLGNNQGTLGNFMAGTGSSSSPSYHSRNNAPNELNEKLTAFVKANSVRITHVAMSPKTFADYTSNTWVTRGPNDINAIRLPAGGVAPLPGIPGITAVIDVDVPDRTLYCVNKVNGLFLGKGPIQTRRYYDEDRDAQVYKRFEFLHYFATTTQLSDIDRKFAMTLTEAAA